MKQKQWRKNTMTVDVEIGVRKKLRYRMKVDSVQEFCKRQVNPIQSFQK